MTNATPRTIYLKGYAPPAFLVPEISLDFEIIEDCVRVRSRLTLARNPWAPNARAPLVLDCDELELEAIVLDGRALAPGEYALDSEHLSIASVPDRFVLETACRIRPLNNTRLEGLYASKDGLFTQCEAEGFRRITYFPDRPDVMSKYTVTVRADRERYPVLLSNGNLVASGAGTTPPAGDGTPPRRGGELSAPPAASANERGRGGQHWVRWEDPFPKPCYLFALVAAKLECLEDSFVTGSGRTVHLSIYVEPGRLDQCSFAMQALKKAMRWDEQAFGREVDLERYTIVAVGDFNMGAMENKGLNIFNTKYVLARPDIATDGDFQNIDRVVAHEYFHNWTGNRVTCRDWFQLSLKEGLTVFREQEFGADMYSRAVQRIQEVRALRAAQFPEDAGPMAHPVRPASYMEISNFYTATVYEKGAEVVRMQHTLLGPAGFRKGMDLYFARHDGQAVTCDDFVQAMADASGVDLEQFKRWYSQAGTPRVEVSDEYDAETARYKLALKQSCPPTSGEEAKLPFHIPLALGLVGPEGTDMPLQLEGEAQPAGTTRVLSLKGESEQFVFLNVRNKPVPSLARGFSAPVIVKFAYDEAALTHLMAHDSDSFNRWEAGHRLGVGILLRAVASLQAGRAPEMPQAFGTAFARVLEGSTSDPAFAAEALSLPSETYLAEQMAVVDPDAIHSVRNWLRRHLAQLLEDALELAYRANQTPGPYSPDAASAGRRALANLCLSYLMELDDAKPRALCLAQLERSSNMTDALAALTMLANCDCAERAPALSAFYERWQDEPLVVDKWLAVQAASRLPSTLAEVRRLTGHRAFDIRNPNKVYALVRGFCANQVRFHAADGLGYAFAADKIIELDPINPQVAARIARAFDRWRKFDAARQAHAIAALTSIQAAAGLSRDVSEIVGRALA